ncbi:asparagine synthase-related protein [Cohnella sp. 56]|uniref:asparagine synthase-related protein n=1 Tax=Cohnella sp. 56 TaxID=3113722 RepID=UPI0030EA711E
MSVIAGVFFKRGKDRVLQTLDMLYRRIQCFPGDSAGYWSEGAVGLACRHQWITPESRSEKLPYVPDGQALAITADAILDNREQLFERLGISLARRGEMTDSELILHAYVRWGVDTPVYLIGDYAFAIWDSRSACLFAARDPLGNRTLYFTDNEERFAFCTAIEPLLRLPRTDSRINEVWLSEYLAIPTMLDSTDPSSTVFSAVRQIPPSHSLMISGSNRLILSRFDWLALSGTLRYRRDHEYIEAFHEVFSEAVRSKLRTYKAVGASLSGGLDSGAVVSYAATALQQDNRELQTYSYLPPGDFVDWTSSSFVANERPFIEATVRHVGGNIREEYLDLASQDPFSEMDELLNIREMPYKAFENSFWVKALYDNAGRQGAGVLLTGAQGNHTISWGPALDYYTRLLKRMRWIRLHQELRAYSRRMRVGRSRLLPLLGKEAVRSVLPVSLQNSDDEFPAMIHPDFALRMRVRERLKEGGADAALHEVGVWSQRERHFDSAAIQNLIGTSGAKFSLRFGLWERDPTADLRVIRFCLSLPTEQFVKQGMDRALIRRATKGRLPDIVRLNQRVRGVQGVDWIHRMQPVWAQFISELRALSKDSLVAGLINIPLVTAGIRRIEHGARSEFAMDDEVRFLMRCLIVYRFLKQKAYSSV